MRLRRFALAALLVLGIAPTAMALPIALSDAVASGGSATAEELAATLDFSVDATGTVVTLSVTNDTVAPARHIRDIYFNASSAVTGLTLTGISPEVANYTLAIAQSAGSFGEFDYLLDKGGGNPATRLNPGETAVFTFQVTGVGLIVDSDFAAANANSMIAAADFQGGGIGGATALATPEPGAATLLGLGLAGLALLRRSHA